MKVTRSEAELLDALQRGRYDIDVFAREVLGLDPNWSQRRWFSLLKPEDGWQWQNRRVLHVAANQIGKTLGLGVILTWACWYKIGVDPKDSAAWQLSPYQWLHLAPSQNQAYLTLNDMRLLVKGIHPAQSRPCILPAGTVRETKVETYYDGLEFWNGSIIQFRTSEEKAKAIQGRRAAGISMDECAFEPYLKEVLNTALLMRLASTGGPFIGVSTPNGINDWFELVQEVIDHAVPREPVGADDPLVGGFAKVGEPLPIWRNEDNYALLWSTVEDNVGYGILPEVAEQMERDLDPATREQQLRGAFLEPAEAFFSPTSTVVDAFVEGMPEQELPLPGHSYVIAWDPSMASDPTVALVLDVTKTPWRGVAFKYWARPPGDVALILEMYSLHALYNGSAGEWQPGQKPRAITVFDSTSMGGAMLASQLSGLHPKKAINMAGPTQKSKMLINARSSMASGQVKLPQGWYTLYRELLNYRLPDTKIRQDAVMAFCLAADVAARGFSGTQSRAFSPTANIYAPRVR